MEETDYKGKAEEDEKEEQEKLKCRKWKRGESRSRKDSRK